MEVARGGLDKKWPNREGAVTQASKHVLGFSPFPNGILGDCMAVSYKSDVHTKSHDWVVDEWSIERANKMLDFFFFPIEIK